MYVLDRNTMLKAEALADGAGVSYYQLMENAGCGAARFIMTKTKADSKNVVCLCGCGNNGGDGLVIARELYKAGAKVTVVLPLGQPATACSKQAFTTLQKDIPIVTDTEITDLLNEADIIVDALFGTGLSRRATPEIEDIFQTVSHVGARVFAIDLPSGVAADTGEIFGQAVFADYTITFAALKYCHILPPASGLCGETACIDIGISEDILKSLPQPVKAIDPPFIRPRHKNSHKGTFGTALSVTGSYGMAGAAIIAGRAALRSGVGILKAACIEENYTASVTAMPEAVHIPLKSEEGCFAAASAPRLLEELRRSDALLIGCGMGRAPQNIELIRSLILASEVPVILDADGINCILPDIEFIKQVKAPLILTPHPGEMARLTGLTVAEVEAHRIEVARYFAKNYGVIVCLKGSNTIVADHTGQIYVNLIGNPGMATAGSGDMLAGIMLATAASGGNIVNAVKRAVWLHSAAGDATRAELGENAMLPTDMIERLHRFL